MNKSELVASVATKAGVERKQAEEVLQVFFDTVQSEAKGGGSIRWPGFGSFSTTQRNARTGRNPQTGAPVKIAASTAMKFSPSATLKGYLNAKAAKKTAAKKGTAAKTTAKKAPATRKAATTAKKAPARASAAKKTTKRA